MAQLLVTFTFHSGVARHLFRNVRLSGSWDSGGRFSDTWTQTPMAATGDGTGCDAFSASVSFDSSQTGTTFAWGVIADTVGAPNTWVIATEVPDQNSSQRYRTFVLGANQNQQDYWFVTGRRFGAQKYTTAGAAAPGGRFAVWAPYAQKVEVVFAPFDSSTGTPSGYIADDGTGVDPASAVIPMVAQGNGIWESDISATPALADFSAYLNRLYMYRVTNDQGAPTYKVDIYSRAQAGRGANNPGGAVYNGSYLDLDGIVSCSIVSDPDQVTADFNDTGVAKQTLIPAGDFWASEYTAGRIPPQNLENLIIYEMHVGSLGFPLTTAGTFGDAMDFVDSLAPSESTPSSCCRYWNSTETRSGATERRSSTVCKRARAAEISSSISCALAINEGSR
jgi:1,4-alpha-glucan branching enzyme